MHLLRSTRISKKLPVLIVSLMVLTALVTAAVFYTLASRNAFDAAREKLIALQVARRDGLQSYLASIEKDLSTAAYSMQVTQALLNFDAAWDRLESNQQETLQRLYITDNPYPTGSKEELDSADDGSEYSSVHETFHPWFRYFLRERGYYDIFLVNMDGNLVYSVYKELDYATNLNDGQWRDTDLGNAFRAAINGEDPLEQYFLDFKPYEPSFGAPASFISQAVTDFSGNIIGALIFQMPIAQMNSIMQSTAGMGESGETYLVGSDYLMRSDSRFSEESTMLKTRVTGETVDAALMGNETVQIVMDYRGIPVLSASGPLTFKDVTWAVLAEIDEAEVMQPIVSMRNTMLLVLLVVLAAAGTLALVIARSISEPILGLGEVMRKLASGNIDLAIPHWDRKDEIGEMAGAVEIFKSNALKTRKLEAERQTAERAAAEQKRQVLTDTADQLESRVGAILRDVNDAMTALKGTAANLSNIAETSNSQVHTLHNESETVTQNLNTVAAAAEELSTSINDITTSVTHSRRIAASAVEKALSAKDVIGGLIESSNRIGEVVNLINDVAEQINLLALNATIEAARAGDAGKGFAVVASEVKNLSTQAADATQQISGHIAQTQSFSEATAKVLGEIGEIIDEMKEISGQVGDSIEAQNASTGEISHSINESASSTSTVNSSVESVASGARQTGEAAFSVQQSIEDLASQCTTLNGEIQDFVHSIRASN